MPINHLLNMHVLSGYLLRLNCIQIKVLILGIAIDVTCVCFETVNRTTAHRFSGVMLLTFGWSIAIFLKLLHLRMIATFRVVTFSVNLFDDLGVFFLLHLACNSTRAGVRILRTAAATLFFNLIFFGKSARNRFFLSYFKLFRLLLLKIPQRVKEYLFVLSVYCWDLVQIWHKYGLSSLGLILDIILLSKWVWLVFGNVTQSIIH